MLARQLRKITALCFRERLFCLGFFSCLMLALVLRCWAIETRPLHSDEGVNYHFLQKIAESGVYDYSHANYHGPAFHWLEYGVTGLFGFSVLSLRLLSIICGVLLVLLLLRLRPLAGSFFTLCAGFLICLSPSLVFFSRYAIHEMLFLLSCACFAVELYILITLKRKFCFYTAAAAASLMVATKETFIIFLPVICAACLLLLMLSPMRLRPFPGLLRENFSRPALLAVSVVFLFYSSWLRSFKGVAEFLFSLPQWTTRGTVKDIGHFRPFWHYAVKIIAPTEPLLLLGLGISAAVLVWSLVPLFKQRYVLNHKVRLLIYFSAWSIGIFLAYSAIPYKTPWLVINITLPLILVLAAALGVLAGQTQALRYVSYALFVLFAAAETKNMIHYNLPAAPVFRDYYARTEPYGPENPFSYVHTTAGMLDLVRDLEDYWAKHPDGHVLVGVNSYWPLPYYTRKHKGKLAYFVPTEELEKHKPRFSVIIAERSAEWTDPAWRLKSYRLSGVEEANVYFKPDL